jgi:small subunit ribosomal protein S7
MAEQELQTVEEVKEEVKEVPKKESSGKPQLVFDLYDISEVEVKDPGLKGVINLDYALVIKSRGRFREKFGKANVNIVERLINTASVPGHRGKKHKIMTRWATGKYNKNAKQVLDAFEIIHKKTGENPIQVLVNAIEHGCPMDEVTMIQYGGARYPQAVDSSPLRRVSVALRNISHGAYDKSFDKKKTFSRALAEEIMATASGSGDSAAVAKKGELERQADSAR